MSLESLTHRQAAEMVASLTPRERDVLDLLVQEALPHESAKQLGITQHTLDSYMKNIRQKFGVRSRIGIAIVACKAGVI